MREEDPLATSSPLWPHEDPDENNFAAWCALSHWMEKVKPFCRVEFQHARSGMLRVGRKLTAHVDADEHARRAAKAEERAKARRAREGPDSLEATIKRIGELAEWHRDRMDHVASGW
jgi:hypothetical protein